jgi:hypothetical protein
MGEDHLELPVGYRFGRIPVVVEAQVLSGRLIGLSGKIGDEVNSVDLELGLLSSCTSANFVKSFQEKYFQQTKNVVLFYCQVI